MEQTTKRPKDPELFEVFTTKVTDDYISKMQVKWPTYSFKAMNYKNSYKTGEL